MSVTGHRRGILSLGAILALALFVVSAIAVAACEVETITVPGDCFYYTTSGNVTVDNAPQASTVTLEVYAYDGATGKWVATGATESVSVPKGTSTDAYTITIPTEYFASPYTQMRVEAISATNGIALGSPSNSYSACNDPKAAESPLAVGLPLAAMLLFGGAFVIAVRRRRGATADA
jgi:hypothetical protein